MICPDDGRCPVASTNCSPLPASLLLSRSDSGSFRAHFPRGLMLSSPPADRNLPSAFRSHPGHNLLQVYMPLVGLPAILLRRHSNASRRQTAHCIANQMIAPHSPAPIPRAPAILPSSYRSPIPTSRLHPDGPIRTPDLLPPPARITWTFRVLPRKQLPRNGPSSFHFLTPKPCWIPPPCETTPFDSPLFPAALCLSFQFKSVLFPHIVSPDVSPGISPFPPIPSHTSPYDQLRCRLLLRFPSLVAFPSPALPPFCRREAFGAPPRKTEAFPLQQSMVTTRCSNIALVGSMADGQDGRRSKHWKA
jgi:hypothetical protein